MSEREMMDKKDMNVLRVADKYVTELRERPETWRAFWELEGKLLEQKKGK
jgi:hypothetical protein